MKDNTKGNMMGNTKDKNDNKNAPDSPQVAYVLRASITDASKKIWRKLRVPGNYTLGDLHKILQIAFGWENRHMHSFTVKATRYGMATEDFGFSIGDDVVDEDTVSLHDFGLRPNQKFEYLYDFGDSWQHDITVSKIIPIGPEDEELTRPCCLEGERAGPHEDSGGIWGYEDMLEILKDPKHKEYEDIHEWLGDFDPEYISLEDINAMLDKYVKPQSKKAKKGRRA